MPNPLWPIRLWYPSEEERAARRKAECAEAVAAERARIRDAVEGLRVASKKAGRLAESDYFLGFRASRNETVAAVLAIIDREDTMPDHLPAVCCTDHAAMAALDVIRKNGDARIAAERARIRAAVEGLPPGSASRDEAYALGWDDALAAVLAILNPEADDA